MLTTEKSAKISAQVACRQLGFPHARSFGNNAADSSIPIVMDDVQCRGREKTVSHCTHATTHNCGHGEDLSITCEQIRLVDGAGYHEGKRAIMSSISIWSVKFLQKVKRKMKLKILQIKISCQLGFKQKN